MNSQIVISPDYLQSLQQKTSKSLNQKFASWMAVLIIAFISILTIWQLDWAAANTNCGLPISSPISTPISSSDPCPTPPVTPIVSPSPTPTPTPTPAPVVANYAVLSAKRATVHLTTWEPGQTYRVDFSTYADMSWAVYLDFIHAQVDQYGLVFDNNPQKWDKYQCGKTLYWRVLSEDRSFQGPIHSTTIACDELISLEPSAGSVTPGAGGFIQVNLSNYNYNTNAGTYTVYGPVSGLKPNTTYWLWLCRENQGSCDGGLNNTFTTDGSGYAIVSSTINAINYITSKINSIKISQPSMPDSTKCFDLEHPCLVASYQSPVEPTADFSNLSATLSANTANFKFIYPSQIDETYRVDLSIRSDMSWDEYLSFVVGKGGSLSLNDPGKWDKYECNKTLYWRVWNTNRTKSSGISSAVVNCNGQNISRPSATTQITSTSTPTSTSTSTQAPSTVVVTTTTKSSTGIASNSAILTEIQAIAGTSSARVIEPLNSRPSGNIMTNVYSSVANTFNQVSASISTRIVAPIMRLSRQIVAFFNPLRFLRFN